MAEAAKKRPLPSKIAAMKSRKRQKIQTDAGDQEQKPRKPSGGKRLGASELAWKDITLPDRMDDYEGLSGMLEEVDDVRVDRDEVTGNVIFVVPNQDEKVAKNASQREQSSEENAVETVPKPQKTKKGPKALKKAKSEPARPVQAAQPAKPSDDAAPSKGVFDSLFGQSESDGVNVSAWRDLNLSPDTLACLAQLHLARPTPIQRAAIPEILAGHDVVGKASTGSGKTFAFGIPVFERFLEMREDRLKLDNKTPLALILSPTRELADQIEQHLNRLSSALLHRGPSTATLTGGLSMQKQQRLFNDADIVIGTPGRLWDMISSGHGNAKALKSIEFLVIDEADRLLSEGHFKEVEDILNNLDRVDRDDEEDEQAETKPADVQVHRQTLIFSATFDRGLQKKLAGKSNRANNMLSNKESLAYLLSKLKFRDEVPKFIDVNPINQLAIGLKEGLIECGGTEKDLFLYALLLLHSNTRALVFVNSINAVRRLTPLLQKLDVPVLGLHSEMAQKARMRSIERLSENTESGKPSCSILIATDIAARGLDIPNVQLIVHYHLPRAADMYVHRSGRTARAGLKGSSILICAPEEVAGVRKLVATVHAQSALANERTASNAVKQGFYIRTIDIDRRIVARLKERVNLAKTISDADLAKEKHRREDDFMRSAAEELGVEYDSEEFDKQTTGKRGRGGGRKKKEREARELSRDQLTSMRSELKELLKRRVNSGVSERYLASGALDIDELLRQQDVGGGKTGQFLGTVGKLGLDDL